MSRKGSFEERARAEVERIKAERVAQEERKQARMREQAEELGRALEDLGERLGSGG